MRQILCLSLVVTAAFAAVPVLFAPVGSRWAVWLAVTAVLSMASVLLGRQAAPGNGWRYGPLGVIVSAASLTLIDEGHDGIGYPFGLAGPMIALFAASITWRTAALDESTRPSRWMVAGGALATLWLFATTWMWLFTP
jgi:hypothetical protein